MTAHAPAQISIEQLISQFSAALPQAGQPAAPSPQPQAPAAPSHDFSSAEPNYGWPQLPPGFVYAKQPTGWVMCPIQQVAPGSRTFAFEPAPTAAPVQTYVPSPHPGAGPHSYVQAPAAQEPTPTAAPVQAPAVAPAPRRTRKAKPATDDGAELAVPVPTLGAAQVSGEALDRYMSGSPMPALAEAFRHAARALECLAVHFEGSGEAE